MTGKVSMSSEIIKRWANRAAIIFGALSILAGCANLSTINRSTPLDSRKAIHLDIQQRLLIANDIGHYCAEPSPDALAAFAAAAGIGASTPAEGALSASGSLGTSAASIGLRTQSITLMRDALYRMCEAYGNGMLSRPQVMALLSRSQDLTAIILATEQLTGAIVAHQAALTGTASADATSLMAATAELLEAALEAQARAQTRLERALARKADAETKLQLAQDELAAAQSDRSANPNDDEAGRRAKLRLANAQRELETANRQIALAEEIRALREKTLESASDRVESLKSAQDSAAAAAAASASSGATLTGGGDRSRLNDQSTQAIASAVSSMVNNVLNKSYVLDYCMAIISSNDDSESTRILPEDRTLCRRIVDKAMTVEQLRVAGTTDQFDPDDLETTNCIKSWLGADSANKGKLDEWRNKNARGTTHVHFMFGKKSAGLRSAAISDLSISCD